MLISVGGPSACISEELPIIPPPSRIATSTYASVFGNSCTSIAIVNDNNACSSVPGFWTVNAGRGKCRSVCWQAPPPTASQRGHFRVPRGRAPHQTVKTVNLRDIKHSEGTVHRSSILAIQLRRRNCHTTFANITDKTC